MNRNMHRQARQLYGRRELWSRRAGLRIRIPIMPFQKDLDPNTKMFTNRSKSTSNVAFFYIRSEFFVVIINNFEGIRVGYQTARKSKKIVISKCV
jgi:hypothetical protein